VQVLLKEKKEKRLMHQEFQDYHHPENYLVLIHHKWELNEVVCREDNLVQRKGLTHLKGLMVTQLEVGNI
jgi:hypothetical protein